MHAVQELQEDWCETAALAPQRLSSSVAKSVPKRQPLLLYQQPEAVKGSVVRVREQLHQRHHLYATHRHQCLFTALKNENPVASSSLT